MSLIRSMRCAPAAAALSAEEGQSMVELALTLPVLLLVVTGILSFGLALNNYSLLTQATSVGARQLSIARGATTDPCQLTAQAVYSAAPTLGQTGFTFKYVINGANYSGTSCSSTSPTAGAAGNLQQGQPVTVTVTYPCNLQIYKYSVTSGSACVLTSQTTELIQ